MVLGLGRCWQDLGRFADARQVLDAFLAEQPARAAVLVERGRLTLREGGVAPAVPYFRWAVEADPSNLDAHRFLLRCLEEAGGTAEEAARVGGRLRQLEIRDGRIAQLRSEVEAAPDETEPRYLFGLYLLQNGRELEGVNFMNSVLLLDPSHEPARAALAAYSQRSHSQGSHSQETGRPPEVGVRP